MEARTLETPLAQDASPPADQSRDRRVRTVFWSALVIFGSLQAWNSRHVMNSDGICYLDLSDAYLKGGWKMLLNGHWSPLYPCLLAVARLILRPSSYWEFATVHLVNFVAYVAAAAAFEVFLRELLISQQPVDRSGAEDAPLPSWTIRAISYLTFLWLSLTLITLERKSPDMLMSIFVYLSIALIMRIRRTRDNWAPFALLGLVLGLGYLAKAPMFPLAFIVLGTVIFAAGDFKKAAPRVLLAFIVFSAISAPLVLGLSRMEGHFTFGKSGAWNYLTEINGAGPVWYMQNVGSARGRFIHPPQKIFSSPAAYAFEGPVGGTLPIWYDPSYWIAGAQPRLDLHRQLVKLARNAGQYFDLIFTHEAAILAVFVALFWLGSKERVARVLNQWPVWLPALAALGMYLIVLVQERYVAVFLIVLWVVLFASVRLPLEGRNPRLAAGAVLTLAFALGVPLTVSAAGDLKDGLLHRQRHAQWEMAATLRLMGIKPGDRVARIGGLHRVEWARILRARIIAEIPRDQAELFWSADSQTQSQVIESFRKVGATAIVAEEIPPAEVFAPSDSWQRIGASNFFVYKIDGAEQRP